MEQEISLIVNVKNNSNDEVRICDGATGSSCSILGPGEEYVGLAFGKESDMSDAERLVHDKLIRACGRTANLKDVVQLIAAEVRPHGRTAVHYGIPQSSISHLCGS
jgi:hypothetical protein